MTKPLDDFMRDVSGSGLLPDADLRAWLDTLPPDSRPQDGEQLARELVKHKKLTKFQAEQLYAGKGKSLTLGNYVILDKLGEGGMGMVLKARHRRMERTVALKVINPKVVKEPASLKRFQREVVAAAKLTHPNIVAAYDADEAKGTHFLVMEYVEGSDLSSLVKQYGPLSVEQAVSCVMQAARGLAFAHDKGVVHRDIKPHNLLRDQDGTVKILDMGLARIEGGFGGSAEHADLTRSGAMMGTVDYMAPEQAMDSKHADARSDIYSLGCTLFYLVTGHVTFEADTVMKRLTAHQSAPPPSLIEQLRVESRESRTGQSSVPFDSGLATLDAVFRRMVAKKPEDRPQSMLEVVAELERCLVSGSATISSHSGSNQLAGANGGRSLPAPQRQASSELSASGSRTSPGSSIGTSAPTSERDVETIVSGSMASQTGSSDDATLVLDSSTSTSRTGSAPSNKPRKAMWISGAAVVAVLLLIVVAMSGKSPKPSDDKLVANPPNPNPQSSESLPTNREVREPGEPNRSPMDTALMFDGDDRVEIPSLTFDSQGSYTLEGFIASPVKADQGAGLVFGMPEQSYLSFTRLSDWRWVYQPQKRNGGVEIAIAGAAARPERTHLACVRDGQTHHLFVGGKLFHKVGEKPSPAAGTSPFLIGSDFRGLIDELRVSRVARYQADFAPPARHESDSDTLALYHFDEGQGDRLVDSSGNNHHGKITGAKWVLADGSAIVPALAQTPFVTLRNGNVASQHATLEEALTASQPQDVIEVRGAGPFRIGGPKEIPLKHDITLQGAQGVRPLFTFAPGPPDNPSALVFSVQNQAKVRFEELDFVAEDRGFFITSQDKEVELRRCRIIGTSKMPNLIVVIGGKLTIIDSVIGGSKQSITIQYRKPTTIEFTNSVLFGQNGAIGVDAYEHVVRMSRCTILRGHENGIRVERRPNEEPTSATVEPTDSLLVGGAMHLSVVLSNVNWKGRQNVYLLSKPGDTVVEGTQAGKLTFDEWTNSPNKPETGSKVAVAKIKSGTHFLGSDPAATLHPLRSYLEELRAAHPGVGADPAVVAGISTSLTNAAPAANASGGVVDLLALVDVKRDVLAGEWTREANGLNVKQSETTIYVPRLQWPYQPPEEYDFEIEFTPGTGNGTVEQLLSAQSRSFAWVLNCALRDGVKAGFETLDGANLINRKDASMMRPKLLEPGRGYRSRVEVRKGKLRAFLDDELLVDWSGDFQRLDIIPRTALRDKLHLGLAANDRGVLFHKVTVREVSGAGKLTFGVSGSEANSEWTDWLGPRLKHADFFSQFDGRQGWQREGDALTTNNTISGQEVLPRTTRDGAVRLTYLLRDAKLITINARDRTTNGSRELYVAEDQGTQILIALVQGGKYKNLIKQAIPASIPKDAPRTFEFRIVGDTLTATLNGSVVASVKDATLSEGNFALVALKGVLVQKVESQKLDEPR